MAARVDPFLLHAAEYEAGRIPRVVTVGPVRCLALSGLGAPGGAAFQAQASFLLAVARAVKAAVRRERDKDFKLPPLEALWWSCRGDADELAVPGVPSGPADASGDGTGREGAVDGGWAWKLLLRMPSFVLPADVAAATGAVAALDPGVAAAAAAGSGAPKAARAGEVRLDELKEGRCVQALYVGPRGGERATLERMRLVAAEQGLALRGRHHEVYLSDPGRVAPARRRTVLRRPVRAR